jgi:hypothetical protein
MLAMWSAYWRILALSAEPMEVVKRASDGLWFSLRLFLLVALIAGLAGLSVIPEAVAPATLAERIDSLARRIEESSPMAPKIFQGLLEEIIAAIDRVAAAVRSFEPPLGVRPSRIARLVGAWLERPLHLLASWFGLALATWLVARFMGGSGCAREHISLVLLAVAPLAFSVVLDLLSNVVTLDWVLVYAVWAVRLALWIWSAAILARALTIAHRFPLDRAIAVLIVSALVFLLIIPALTVGLVALPLILIF